MITLALDLHTHNLRWLESGRERLAVAFTDLGETNKR